LKTLEVGNTLGLSHEKHVWVIVRSPKSRRFLEVQRGFIDYVCEVQNKGYNVLPKNISLKLVKSPAMLKFLGWYKTS
jgi:hypothetical protein